jgi:hypothetical protein
MQTQKKISVRRDTCTRHTLKKVKAVKDIFRHNVSKVVVVRAGVVCETCRNVLRRRARVGPLTEDSVVHLRWCLLGVRLRRLLLLPLPRLQRCQVVGECHRLLSLGSSTGELLTRNHAEVGSSSCRRHWSSAVAQYRCLSEAFSS